MSFTDNSFTLRVGCSDLSEDVLDDELTSFGIEYDDEAILAFNPALRDDIGRYPVASYAPSDYDLLHTKDSAETNFTLSNDVELSSDIEDGYVAIQIEGENDTDRYKAANHSQELGNRTTDEEIMASGDMSFGRGHEIQRLSAEIVSGIQSKIPRLDRFRQELSEMHEDVKKLKDQYSELDCKYRRASIVQNRTITSAKAYMNNLDLVIYQKRIINHLDDAVKQMRLFECHVTEDRKIIFVDPESQGTDIDTPVHISASRALNLTDTEFKRDCATEKP